MCKGLVAVTWFTTNVGTKTAAAREATDRSFRPRTSRFALAAFIAFATLFPVAHAANAQSAPTVTSLSPNSGSSLGGVQVFVQGTDFTGATAVKFGNTAAQSFTVLGNGTSMFAVSPPGTGTVDVTVTTPAGTSATSAASKFTNSTAAPTITGISPNSGPVAGGTSVTITGTNFTVGTTVFVYFGALLAQFAIVNSPTSITATSPIGTPGAVIDVKVNQGNGTSATSAADQFTYTNTIPSVTSISPNNGPQAGGTSVTITGANFTGTTAVKFGSTAATSFNVSSATQITAISPPGNLGSVDITVTASGGTSPTSAADQFTYGSGGPAPTITSISPSGGMVGSQVQITGTNFIGVTGVKFGSVLAQSAFVNSPTSITAFAPLGVGAVDVTVTTSAGTSATSAADQFTYPATPTVTGISPNSGPVAGGTSVTITGTNFTVGTTVFVYFGALLAQFAIVNSPTSITATSPTGTPGAVIDVRVNQGNATSATSAADQFTYATGTPPPTVTSVSPNNGPPAGGTSVAITGTNFTGATAVKFGNTAATSFSVSSATSITAVSPAGTGTKDVTITTLAGTSATGSADQFTYSATATTVGVTSSLNPSMSGQSVTFTATVSTSLGTPTGNVSFKDGATVLGTGTLSGGTAALSTAALAVGNHSITATYSGDSNFVASISPALVQTVSQAATTTTITSSLNPSEVGKSVTFTATVSSSGGTPNGTVAFMDGPALLGTGILSSGVATFTTSSLTLGSHTITANYAGVANFAASVSATLIQAVNTPADSLKLRALQVLVTPVVGQVSGQAVSGAVDSAISEAFSGSGALVTPNGSGVRFNFAGDPDVDITDSAPRANDPFSSATGSFGSGRGLGSQPLSRTASVSRVDDGFGALAYAGPTKAPPIRVGEPKDWFGWAEVRGATLDHWGSSAVPGATMLYGSQVNLLAGLSRKFTPNFLIGVLGGYETFDYRSDALLGRLKGDGWTVGSYVGWMITTGIRFDAAVAYSGIGYDGSAGTASGSFAGNRWLVASGLTGTYQTYGIRIEPSARIYALWEHENAYTDTLGTLQTARDFATGRASGGVKVSYPVAWSATTSLAPYFGVYGDYYFNSDSAGAPAAAAIPFIVIDG
jgi:hypothetical protein